jgi:hypothetical protein
MPDEKPPTPPDSPPPASPPPAAPARPIKWREEKQGWQSARPEPAAKGGRVFTALAVIVMLVGAIVGLVLLLRPVHEPVVRTIAVTEYSQPVFPINGMAEQDSDALKQRFGEAYKARASQTSDALRRELKNLATFESSEGVVIHLSALALVVDGEVYILPADAGLDNRDTWLLLKQVLQMVHDCRAKRKLLILDIMRPIADARLGILYNNVAEYAHGAVEEALKLDTDLLVLLPCSPGQVTLISDELGMSVFGYYLDEGLRGFADRYNERHKENGRVTVAELGKFVAARVDRWSLTNRRTRQTPQLLGKARDFELLASENKEPSSEWSPPDEYLEGFARGWALRDAWLEDGVAQFAPRALMKLEAVLIHEEQRWLGGRSRERVVDDLKTEITQLERRVQRQRDAFRLPFAPGSLAATEKKPVPAAIADAWKRDFKKLEEWKEGDPKEGEQLKELVAELLKLEAPFPDLVRSGLDAVADETNLMPIKLRLLWVVLEKRSGERWAEALFLQRLNEMGVIRLNRQAEPNRVGRVMEAVQEGLRVMMASERLAGYDPRVFKWLRSQLDAAEEQRSQLEAKLFSDALSSTSQTEALLLALKKLYGTLTSMNDSCSYLQNAYRIRDRVLSLLPGYVSYLVTRPLDDRAWEAEWVEVARLTADLDERLRPPPVDSGQDTLPLILDELRSKTATLARLLGEKGKLFGPFAPERLKELEDIEEMDALLACTWLKAKSRQTVWSRRREWSKFQNDKTRREDEADNQADSKLTRDPETFDSRSAVDRERQRGDLRARVTIALFKLGGLPGVDTLERERAAAANKGSTDEMVQALRPVAEKLRRASIEDIVASNRQLPGADRLSRVVHPFELDDDQKYTGRLWEQETREFRAWLSQRYRREADSPAAPVYWREFFDRLADDYARASR